MADSGSFIFPVQCCSRDFFFFVVSLTEREFDVMFNGFNVNYTPTVNDRLDRGHIVEDLSIE